MPDADGELEPSLDEAIAKARPNDPAALALARARIEQSLFGELAPGFGRFRILEQLGRGGMGVVYSAYDPQLDRGVALKMVEVRDGDREAALAEAKALAKLTHPNVVPVYDVGTEAGRVYIVMELVRGKTLRDWCRDRPDIEILEAYRQAGTGLAAAHAAGLIHRDVKPDNILVGDDERVRVVDFGLACEATAVDGRGAGTPKYMAPEHASALTPAVDQFSFAVSLAESLGGDPPRWVVQIIERGRAADPADRFASMHDLVRALGRDPSRVFRRRLVIASVVAILGVLIVLARSRAESVEICGGGDAEIAAAWTPVQRAMTLGRVSALGRYGKELASTLEPQLVSHATTWAYAHRGACLDHRRGVHSDEMFDRRMICLDRGRIARSELGRIAMTATAESLPGVALAAASLPDPAACADRELLATSVAVPPALAAGQVAVLREEVERARVMVAAGEFVRARTTLAGTITRARSVRFPPVLAEALLVDGHAAMSTDDPPAAVAPLREATTLAFSAGAPAIAIEAWARRAYVEGTFVDAARALDGVEIVEALAASTPTHFARALLANNLASVAWLAGRRDEAQKRIAVAEEAAAHVTGAGRVELLVIHANHLVTADDPTQLDTKQEDVVRRLTEAVGATHPLTLLNRYMRVTVTMSDPRAMVVELEATCEAMESHPSLPQRTANCWAELAEIRDFVADRAGAIAAGERAIREVIPDLYPELPGYLAWWRGDTSAAVRVLREAAATIVPDEGSWYPSFHRAKTELALARVLLVDRGDEARQLASSALTTFSNIPINKTAIVRRYILEAIRVMGSS